MNSAGMDERVGVGEEVYITDKEYAGMLIDFRLFFLPVPILRFVRTWGIGLLGNLNYFMEHLFSEGMGVPLLLPSLMFDLRKHLLSSDGCFCCILRVLG